MSELLDFKKYVLYPTVFENLDTVFSEFNFKSYSKGWRSSLKLDLSNPKEPRPDKTISTSKVIGYLLEQGEISDTISFVDYVIKRDNLSFIEAINYLAKKVNLEVPKGDFNSISYQDNTKILEDCNSYFIYCLENSTGSKEVKQYLNNRGYSLEDIKNMELGFIPAQDKLFKYLIGKGYSQNLINEVVKLNNSIGSTHNLTIPYRVGGNIKGFKFRTIGDNNPKYLNTTGLDKNGGFFNITGLRNSKEIVIVEGELDCLHATVKGLNNVVSAGGNSINTEQIKDAIKRGINSFTLCFDTEPAKEEATNQSIKRAIEVLLENNVYKIYIVNIPSLGGDKTDPDKLIKEKGIEAFKDAIDKAKIYYNYYVIDIFSKYRKIQDIRQLTDKDIDNLLNDITETSLKLKNPIDRDRYIKLILDFENIIKNFGISKQSLNTVLDDIASNKNKEQKEKKFNDLLLNVKKQQEKGDINKAIELLETELKEVKFTDKNLEFSKFLTPTTEQQIKEEEKNLPDSLNTGFTIDNEEFLLPSGAITVIVAPTNHGKSLMLINTVLNLLEIYPDKKFVFFTYEERENMIIQYFLNAYLNIKDLNKGNNRRTLKDYFKTNSSQFISQDKVKEFEKKKDDFFKKYIETGRILVKYTDLYATELNTAIEYLAKNEPKIGGVFIDYFQLLSLPNKKNSRQEELKEICISLKNTAINTGLPIVLAGQFNREVTNLARLLPTHIGEAGDIERVVNTLIGLWNMTKKGDLKVTSEEQKDIDKRLLSRNKNENDSTMYIEILKSRDLPTGLYEFLDYNGKTGKIKNTKTTGIDKYL